MNVLKLLATLMILGGAVAMVFGTGAFAAINADRLVDVGVASDDSALLGIEIEGGSVDSGEQVTLISVENRMGSAMDSMEVTVVDTGPFNNVQVRDVPDSLPAGGTGEITATVAGSPSTSGTIELRIVAVSASGTSVDLTREVRVEIDSPGVGLCTIENDDRIGERQLDAEDELFDCTIRIDADQQYEVGFENSTATGGFELSARLLKQMEFEESQIGGATDIQVSQNANGDIQFETTTFGDDVSIAVEQVAKGISLEDSTIEGNFQISTRNQNGDIKLEESTIDGSVAFEFDGPVSGNIETEDTQIGGDYEIVVNGNLNQDIQLENVHVDGDLAIVVEGNQNGDIKIEDSSIDGDLTVVVEGNSNGDVDLEDNSVGGEETVDVGSSGGGPPGG